MRSSCSITSWSKVFLEQRFAGPVMGHFTPLLLRLPLRNFLIPSLCGLKIIIFPAAEYRATKRLLAAKNTSQTTQPTLGLFEVLLPAFWHLGPRRERRPLTLLLLWLKLATLLAHQRNLSLSKRRLLKLCSPVVEKHRQHTSTIHPCQQDRVVIKSSCRITSWSKYF